jgi:protein lifeguard
MAANTKYHAAPQRDSFEERSYTQAPPSYQAAGPSDGILGSPRGEDDNVPDDFKVRPSNPTLNLSASNNMVSNTVDLQFGGSVSEATLDIRMQFIRKVYAILTVQLLLTAVLSSVSFFSHSYRRWIQSNSWMMWGSLFGAIAFMLLTFWKRKSYPTNLLFLTGFTLLEAYAISVITSFYESRIVIEALILTLGIFVALTLFACQSKYDFTSWMPYLFGALWVLVIFGFMAAFFPGGKTIELVYGVAAALIFSGYILVDTQLVMRHYHVEEEIAAAISLYLDVINLFLAILRILNSQQNN